MGIFLWCIIHSLLHLYEDVEHFGCSLNEVSAFKFENNLQRIKHLVRQGKHPLTQVCKRLNESEQVNVERCSVGREHGRKTLRESDSWYLLRSGDIACVTKRTGDGVACKIVSERQSEDFFVLPCESRLLGIRFVRDKHMKNTFLTKLDVERKVVCFPHCDGYVLFPLCHESEKY